MCDLSALRRLLVLSLLSAFALSCGPLPTANNSSTDSKFAPRTPGTRGGSITYRISEPPSTFNYLVALSETSILMSLYLMQSRPIEFDQSTQRYRAALAESWTFGPDRQTLDVKLRDGLKFSDGHPLTTEDVAFSLAAMYDPRSEAASWVDSMTINGKPITTKVVDDRNMQFIFPEPVSQFENYIDNIGVLPKHVLNADFESGKLAQAYKLSAAPETIVTSGPFAVESAATGDRIVLKRNPQYWRKDEKGTQLPYLDQLALEVVGDPNQAMVRVNQNAIDIFDRIRATDYASLLNSSGPVKAFDLGPGIGVDHIVFNMNTVSREGKEIGDPVKQAWFNDKRFRQAVSHAVDRTTIATTTLQGLASPLYGFVSPGNHAWLDPKLPKIDFDLKRSESILTEAGFVKRGTAEAPELYDSKGNRVEFSLIFPGDNEPRKLMAGVIQQDLAKLGIKMNVVPLEAKAIATAATKTYDYDAVLYGLTVAGTDPSAYANLLLSSSDTHQWRPAQKTPATEWEARVDKLFADVSTEMDPQKRASLFYEIQQIMAEETPVVPVVARHIVSAANTRLGNYAPTPIFPYSLWNIDEIFVKQPAG